MLKAVGITDEINTCDCCGKTNLKRTVVFRDDEAGYGNIYYGTTCATRNTGRARKEINREIKDHELAIKQAAWNEYVNCESAKSEKEAIRYANNNRQWTLEQRFNYLDPFIDADRKAEREIAEKYGLDRVLYVSR